MKLHIGCGTVYLEEYVNIHPYPDKVTGIYGDIFNTKEYGTVSFDVASEEDINTNKTNIDNYYKSPFTNRPNIMIADVQSTLCGLNIREYKADEICMFHVLEHIPKYELTESLLHIFNLLNFGGRFRVAVPDIDSIVVEFAEKIKSNITEQEKEWYYRFIYGTQKDKWSHHYCGYNKNRLTTVLKEVGFSKFEDLKNQNWYPSVHLLATKG